MIVQSCLMLTKMIDVFEKRFFSSSAQLFNSSCDELVSWMKDKEKSLSGNVNDLDLETVRKLQRKHQV